MKRLLSTTAAALALAAVSTGCGIAKDNTAATIDGVDISFDDVKALAEAEEVKASAPGLVSAGEGSIGSASLRSAASEMITLQALEAWVEGRGGVTEADRSSAAQQRPSSDNAAFNKFLDRYLPVNAAFGRIAQDLMGEEPEAVTAEIYPLLRPVIGSVYCVDVVELYNGEPADFEAIAGSDTAIDEIDADALGEIAAPVVTADQCVTGLELSGLTEELDAAPVGKWTLITIDANGQEIDLFVKKASTRPATQDDEAVTNLVDQLVADPQIFGQMLWSGVISSADVTVDPRLGSWAPTAGGLQAPYVPQLPVVPVDDSMPQGLDADMLAELEAMMGAQQ